MQGRRTLSSIRSRADANRLFFAAALAAGLGSAAPASAAVPAGETTAFQHRANALCQSFYRRVDRLDAAALTQLALDGQPATFSQEHVVHARLFARTARLSLRTDVAFLRLRPAAALESGWQAAVQAEQAGGRMLALTARRLRAVQTAPAEERVVAVGMRAYGQAERPWDREAVRLGLSACTQGSATPLL